MRILSCSVLNFGSYEYQRFNFDKLGLAIVSGSTGSGKSTLQDTICWTLYGITSKRGGVDEVRSWTAPKDKTIGEAEVLLPSGLIQIVRVRGKPSENDLFWWEGDNQIRGKDIKDTQALLDRKLGVSADLYLTAVYASEFSPTGSFFLASAKTRREVLETICDMSFPISMDEKVALERKSTKLSLMTKKADMDALRAQTKYAESSVQLLKREMDTWIETQRKNIEILERKSNNFNKDVASKASVWDKERTEKIHSIVMSLEGLSSAAHRTSPMESKACPTCGHVSSEDSKHRRDLERFKELKRELQQVQDTQNPHLSVAVNPYAEQVEAERARSNPHAAQMNYYLAEIIRLGNLQDADTEELQRLQQKANALEQLQDMSANIRGLLLDQAVGDVQRDTNRRLSKFFDAEISVQFSLDADQLEVSINKNGYDCTYSQLSKGQRQLLRLCFMTSMMEQAASNAGVHFNLLCFDESLDGLDPELKVKAFPMFEELAQHHDSVLVIEHSAEFKELFPTKVSVTLVNDRSTVEVSN